jgi:hypothetical protein
LSFEIDASVSTVNERRSFESSAARLIAGF